MSTNLFTCILTINIMAHYCSFGQLLTSTGGSITNSSMITVNGDVLFQISSSVNNNGAIEVTGNWTNNSGGNLFGSSPGTVYLNGGSQSIGGSDVTLFNDLDIDGGPKTLSNSISVGGLAGVGVLHLNDVNLILNSNNLTVTNQSISAITATSGGIISEQTDNSSKVNWNIGTTSGNHIIPYKNILGEAIPFSINVTAGDVGTVATSTYATSAANLPLPVSPVLVSNIQNIFGSNNSANTVDRFWHIEKTGTAGVASLSFTYGNSEIAASGNFGMKAQWWNPSGIGWDFAVPGQIITGPNTLLVPMVTNFGTWAIAAATSPLPIELFQYIVQATDHNSVLNSWITLSEKNNDYYTIERSRDGIDFEMVGIQQGHGTTSIVHQYSFEDKHAYSGVSYYRLKQTDFDGKYTYSDIRTVNFNQKQSDLISVFPNPATDEVYVSTAIDLSLLEIIDIAGKSIIQIVNIEDNSNVKLDISHLAPGIYFIKPVQENTIGNVIRLIKN